MAFMGFLSKKGKKRNCIHSPPLGGADRKPDKVSKGAVPKCRTDAVFSLSFPALLTSSVRCQKRMNSSVNDGRYYSASSGQTQAKSPYPPPKNLYQVLNMTRYKIAGHINGKYENCG
jgi:hypothetical protein